MMFDDDLFPESEDLTDAGDDAGSGPAPRPVGLQCSQCGCRHFYVVKTTPQVNGKIRRRRECRNCGRRITTTESMVG